MKARITKTGKHFGYRWQVGRIYSFTLTRPGALWAVRRYVKELRFAEWAKQNAETIELSGK